MDTHHEELLALAEELMHDLGLPLAVALDAAALELDDATAYAAGWDAAAQEQRNDELAAFAREWDQASARLQALA